MSDPIVPNASPGTYVLILELDRSRTLQVGRLGLVALEPGLYAYVGSAMGSGGIAARVARHLRPAGARRRHWHIDILTEQVSPIEVWWAEGDARRECEWAGYLASRGTRPLPGFGSSDCRCLGHLAFFGPKESLDGAWNAFRQHFNDPLQRAQLHPGSARA